MFTTATKKLTGLAIQSIDQLDFITYFKLGKSSGRSFDLVVESKWIIKSPTGEPLAEVDPQSCETAGQLVRLLIGQRILSASPTPPRGLVMTLEDGSSIEVTSNPDGFESWCVPQLNYYI